MSTVAVGWPTHGEDLGRHSEQHLLLEAPLERYLIQFIPSHMAWGSLLQFGTAVAFSAAEVEVRNYDIIDYNCSGFRANRLLVSAYSR